MKCQHKGRQILKFVKEAGWEGRTFTEIQRFICELNGHDFDVFYFDKWENRKRRTMRGYYCVALQTLLPAHCQKIDKKYVLRGPIPLHPYSLMARKCAYYVSEIKYNKGYHKRNIALKDKEIADLKDKLFVAELNNDTYVDELLKFKNMKRHGLLS